MSFEEFEIISGIKEYEIISKDNSDVTWAMWILVFTIEFKLSIFDIAIQRIYIAFFL